MNIKLIGAGITIVACFGAGVWTESQIAGHTLKTRLEEQQKSLTAECDKDKALTKGAQDDLQKNFDIINAKLAARKLQPARCVQVTPIKANVAEVHGEHAGKNGISSDWLNDYGAECEQIRQVFLSCDKFTDDERR